MSFSSSSSCFLNSLSPGFNASFSLNSRIVFSFSSVFALVSVTISFMKYSCILLVISCTTEEFTLNIFPTNSLSFSISAYINCFSSSDIPSDLSFISWIFCSIIASIFCSSSSLIEVTFTPCCSALFIISFAFAKIASFSGFFISDFSSLNLLSFTSLILFFAQVI